MGEIADAAPAGADEIAFALRRMRREQYRIESRPDGPRLALLMRASPAGRRNAAEHVVTWLAERGLRLEAADPVAALTDGAVPTPVVRA